MASLLKNWVVLIKKYEKWKPNEKFSIIVNTLVRSNICLFLLVRDFVLFVYDLIELIFETSY